MSNKRKPRALRRLERAKRRGATNVYDLPSAVGVPPIGIVEEIDLPPDEKVVVKTVPAKVGDVVVGEAIFFDDGTFGVKIDDEADPEALEIIRGTAREFGYSIEV